MAALQAIDCLDMEHLKLDKARGECVTAMRDSAGNQEKSQ